MKKTIFFLSAIALLGLSGCNDSIETVGTPVQTGDEIQFGSFLSNSLVQTRTVYGNPTEFNDANGRYPKSYPVNWEDGDEIMIFCPQASQPSNGRVNYRITPDPSKPAMAVRVDKIEDVGLQWGTGEGENGTHRFYGIYPASAVKGTAEESQKGKITFNIPELQKVGKWEISKNADGSITYNGIANTDYAYMYAFTSVNKNEVTDQNPVNLQFRPLTTVLEVIVNGPNAADETINVTNLNIIAQDENTAPVLTGDFICGISTDGSGDEIISVVDDGSSNYSRSSISIPLYINNDDVVEVESGLNAEDYKGKPIALKKGDMIRVRGFFLRGNDDNLPVNTLQVAVAQVGTAPKKKNLQTADIAATQVNIVDLPAMEKGGTNYWMSSIPSNTYISELSIPGSKFSVLTEKNNSKNIYQTATIEQQFQDGIRAFIFQTATKGSNSNGSLIGRPENNTFEGDIKVVSEGAGNEVMSLEDAVKEIASYLDNCEKAGKMNEFAFLMLTYATSEDSDEGTGEYYSDDSGWIPVRRWRWIREPRNADQTWINLLRDKVNELAAVTENRIYTGEITPNTTIDDVKGKIILKANYNSEDMLKYYTDPKSFVYNGPDVKTTAPIMFTFWGTATGPDKADDWTYQDKNGGMPMDWGVPVWYANSTAQLRWYYQEVTSVGSGAEATKQQKEDGIKRLFTESVSLYKKDNSHKTWFMNDLGGYYSDSGDIKNRGTGQQALAMDMNQMAVDELQKRTENAGLGLVFMNFADMQPGSGPLYQSDWLIQTLIDNNFKFELRVKGGTASGASYNASYTNGGNAVGWD